MSNPEQISPKKVDYENWSHVFGYGYNTETNEFSVICNAGERATGIPPDWIRMDIDDMSVVPGRYVHFKGDIYRAYGVGARESNETERYVVYTAGGVLPEKAVFWLRPVDMFLEDVEVDGMRVPRFSRLGD